MMEPFQVILFEREGEFASCLSDFLKELGAAVKESHSYRELLSLLAESPPGAHLICDLSDDQETEIFLRELVDMKTPPFKIVFTSIYDGPNRWPLLQKLRGDWIFIEKPFRTQIMTSFLFPQWGHHSEGA